MVEENDTIGELRQQFNELEKRVVTIEEKLAELEKEGQSQN